MKKGKRFNMKKYIHLIDDIETGYRALLHAIFYSSPIDEKDIENKMSLNMDWSGVFVHEGRQKAFVIEMVNGEIVNAR